MVLSTGSINVIKDYRKSVRRTFCKFYVTLYNGLEYQLLEVALHFIIYLVT